MYTLLISYDLRKAGRDYPQVQAAIREAGSFAHPLESVWFIQTPYDAVYWRDKLKQHIDSNDGLMVVSVAGSGWATTGLDQQVLSWMQQRV